MSTTAAVTTAPLVVKEPTLLRDLAMIQARRYAAHPLFIIGVALLAFSAVAVADDGPKGYGSLEDGIAVALLIGVLGIVVGYRLTTNESRALELLQGTPVTAVTRTLALCLACLVPFGVGLLWFLTRMAAYALWPPREALVEAVGGNFGLAAIAFGASAMCALGGPQLGVAAGRWLRFPGAGALLAILVTVATAFFVSGALTPTLTDNAVVQTTATLMPFTEWVLVDIEGGVDSLRGVRSGVPTAHVLYQVGLCGLVVCAALLKDAVGTTRRRCVLTAVPLAGLTVIAAAWAVLGP